MFKAYVNFKTFFNHCRTFKKISNSGYELKPFDDYFMSFGCKTGSESAEARESNKLDLNNCGIDVMHIGIHTLILFFSTSEDRGQKSIFK